VETLNRKNILILGIILISMLSALYILFVNVGQETPSSEGPEPEENHEIIIGVLAAIEDSISRYALISGYAEQQINEFCNISGLPYVFRFEVGQAGGSAAGALERVEEWKARGVNLVVGPPWSAMFCPTRQYADYNGMVVMSHESTSPVLAVDDHGYRLTIHDWKEAQVIIRILEEDHVEAVVCLSRADAWGEGLVVELSEKYDGELVDVSYSGEYISFLDELKRADETVRSLTDRYGEGHVAVLALSFTEIATILNQSTTFPALQSVAWYGPGLMTIEGVSGEVGEVAARLNLISFAPIMPESPELVELNALFRDEFGEDIGFYEANIYDVSWILSLAVLEAGADDASALRALIPDIAAGYLGVTGECTLDQYGDRNVALYGVYRYEIVDGVSGWSKSDEYHMDFDEVFNREGVY